MKVFDQYVIQPYRLPYIYNKPFTYHYHYLPGSSLNVKKEWRGGVGVGGRRFPNKLREREKLEKYKACQDVYLVLVFPNAKLTNQRRASLIWKLIPRGCLFLIHVLIGNNEIYGGSKGQNASIATCKHFHKLENISTN